MDTATRSESTSSASDKLKTLSGYRRWFILAFVVLTVLLVYNVRYTSPAFAVFEEEHRINPIATGSGPNTTLNPITSSLKVGKTLDMVRSSKPKMSFDEELHMRLHQAHHNKKTIVLWDSQNPFGRNFSDVTLGMTCGSCEITRNSSRIYEVNATAVVFNYRAVRKGNMPPEGARRPDQLYVWQTGESPVSLIKGRYMDFKFEDQCQFNATMMVRRDSDVYVSYGPLPNALQKRKNAELYEEYNGDLNNILRNKTGFVVAVISNCHYAASPRRMQLVMRLMHAGLKVDGFGKCFRRLTPKTGDRRKDMAFIAKYKFYLAFENSYRCKDYITEKFFMNALMIGVLPVVWGPKREDYEVVAPPNSFIHIDDFATPMELIQHLEYLDKNDTAYLEYFRWYLLGARDTPDAERKTGTCQLCRILHGINADDRFNLNYKSKRPLFTDGVSPRTLPPMKSFLTRSENKECFIT